MKLSSVNSILHSPTYFVCRTLVDACNKRDVNAVKSLLASGWSANEATDDGESLLSLACSSGQYELVEVNIYFNFLINF